jgi:DNA-directed RNA polymerase subunit RPC12/RpoP
MTNLREVKFFCPACGTEFGIIKNIRFGDVLREEQVEIYDNFDKKTIIREGEIFCPFCSYRFNAEAINFIILYAMDKNLGDKVLKKLKLALLNLKEKEEG